MNTSSKILLPLGIVILAVGGLFYFNSKNGPDPVVVTPTVKSIKGCYHAAVAKDRYLLAITLVDGQKIEGLLQYNNFEKDSTKGIIEGTYADGILTADYSFSAEGKNSVSEVMFKKTENGFVRGFGEVKSDGKREYFVDPSSVQYDNSIEYTYSSDCSIPSVV